MRSRDVLNIHDSNARLSVSDIHTRLAISIRCATHELSYINATSAKLVCMYVCMYTCMYVMYVCIYVMHIVIYNAMYVMYAYM